MMSVLIFKGMTVGILPRDCVFTPDDSGEMNVNLVISTAYNVIPIWIRIACDNFKQAKIASENIQLEWNEDVDKQKALLIAELAPSMQVIVSCGIALDALYDTLRPHARLPEQEIQKWKANGTGRAKQISEVIKRVYKLNNNVFKEFRDLIIQIIEFRDMAVHPSLEPKNVLYKRKIKYWLSSKKINRIYIVLELIVVVFLVPLSVIKIFTIAAMLTS